MIIYSISLAIVLLATIFYTWQARKFAIQANNAKVSYERQSEIFDRWMIEVNKGLTRNEQTMDRLIEESNLLVMIRDDLQNEVEGFKEQRKRATRALHGQNFSRKKKVRGRKKAS